ncbi:MAG: penicillin-binding protein activator, partial [Pseudomonadota bacterium]
TDLVNRMNASAAMSFRYPDTVAVLLPLSGRYAGTAAAVRDGLLAAYIADDSRISRPAIRFYDTASADAVSLLQRAVSDGAQFAIGPLLKDQVDAVAAATPNLPVLALNTTSADGSVTPSVFQFSLAPEHEAAAVAERAVAEGYTRAVALVPDSAWGERLLQAFNARLVELGGDVLTYETYQARDSDFAVPIRTMLHLNHSRERWRQVSAVTGLKLEFEPRRRRDAQFAFVATNPRQGRLIRPAFKYHFAEDMPIFATSAAYEDDADANGRDIDGLKFADMPWVISDGENASGVRDAFSRHWPSRVLRRDRLYAMGYDAYRLIPQLIASDTWLDPWPGVTGRLTLDAGGRIERKLDVAEIRGGTAIQLETLPTPLAPDLSDPLLDDAPVDDDPEEISLDPTPVAPADSRSSKYTTGR